MKKLARVSPVVAALLLVCATPSAYGPDRTKPAAARVGLRPTAAMELQQLAQAWALSVRQVVAILVYVRSWLHNLLVAQDHPRTAMQDGDAEVLLAYARWLDGFPQVVRALPETVALEQPKAVRLKLPAYMPIRLRDGLAVAVSEPASVMASAEARRDEAKSAWRRGLSNSERLTNDARRLSFADPLPSAPRRPSRTKVGFQGLMERQ